MQRNARHGQAGTGLARNQSYIRKLKQGGGMALSMQLQLLAWCTASRTAGPFPVFPHGLLLLQVAGASEALKSLPSAIPEICSTPSTVNLEFSASSLAA
jgi:hypothetical protein